MRTFPVRRVRGSNVISPCDEVVVLLQTNRAFWNKPELSRDIQNDDDDDDDDEKYEYVKKSSRVIIVVHCTPLNWKKDDSHSILGRETIRPSESPAMVAMSRSNRRRARAKIAPRNFGTRNRRKPPKLTKRRDSAVAPKRDWFSSAETCIFATPIA